METQAPYHVSYVAGPATPAASPLVAALTDFQNQANELLRSAGYADLMAQVSAAILPEFGPFYTVSATNPTTVFLDNLSFGMGATPEAALNEFGARLVPALALNASLTELQEAA
ncbi:MAG: hypothetical protein ACRYG7_41055 [Janthinobacterium lividum]